jgi:hypothetical protein
VKEEEDDPKIIHKGNSLPLQGMLTPSIQLVNLKQTRSFKIGSKIGLKKSFCQT